MSIETLSRADFDNLPVYRETIPWLEERAWYRLNGTLGILIFDGADKDWSFVVLQPDDAGVYRGVELKVSLKTAEKAVAELHKAMTKAA